jgi:cytochrome P450
VSRAFVPGRIAAVEQAIRAIAGSLLDELAAAGPGAAVDLIEGYAYPLPLPRPSPAAASTPESSSTPSTSIPPHATGAPVGACWTP